MEIQKVSIDGIVAATGESRAVVYDAINAGHLETFRVGRRRFARPKAVVAWVDFLEAESNAGRPVTYRPRCRDLAGASHAPGTGNDGRPPGVSGELRQHSDFHAAPTECGRVVQGRCKAVAREAGDADTTTPSVAEVTDSTP